MASEAPLAPHTQHVSQEPSHDRLRPYRLALQRGGVRYRALSNSQPRAVSLDGWGDRRLAFLSDRTGTTQLYVVDIVTGAERQVTFDEGTHNSARWAPNGTLVTYMKDNAIWVVDLDNGLPPVQLTESVASESQPCFSPGGTQIVFTSTRVYGHSQRWIMNVDGSDLHRMIEPPSNDGAPSWR